MISPRTQGAFRACSNPALLLVVVATLLLFGFSVGPYMHESDQASLMKGAVDIASGRWSEAWGAYNYDKQFFSYWVLAAIFALIPRPWAPNQIALAGNLLSFGFFWAMIACYVLRAGRRCAVACLVPLVLSPALLVHSPFFATAFVSGGFLLLIALALESRPPSRPGRLLRWVMVFACAFCATGSRADAILAMPLMGLLHSRGRGFKAVLRSPHLWFISSGSVSAVLLGRLLYTGEKVDFLPPFFKPKIFAAYTLFGLGAGALVLATALAAISMCAIRLKAHRFRLQSLAAALAIPFGYYCVQLTTTRYFVLGILSLLLFVCSKRGARIMATGIGQSRLANAFRMMMVACAVLPVVLGLHVERLGEPKLTLSHPTHFPTSDGLVPMGAYLAHTVQVRATAGLMDHNHAIWMAASRADFRPGSNNKVSILRTPMCDYLMLAASLQNKAACTLPLQEAQSLGSFYTDSRSLMRRSITEFGSGQSEGYADLFRLRHLLSASTFDFEGITIFECRLPAQPEGRSEVLEVLNAEFRENEYRIRREFLPDTSKTSFSWRIEPEDAGKTLVLISRVKFGCVLERPGQAPSPCPAREVASSDGSLWYVSRENDPAVRTIVTITAAPGVTITLAIAVLPDWMSLGKF